MWLVTSLGFLFPGLGHLYGRRWLTAAVFGAPVLAVLIYSIIVAPSLDPIAVLFDRQMLTLIAIANALLLLWRIAAMADLARLARDPRRALLTVTLPVCLLAVLMHAIPAWLLGDMRTTIDAITLGAAPSPASAGSRPGPGVPAASAGAGAARDAGGAKRIRPLTILLLGVDSGPDRTTRLTDTMLVVSIHPADGRAALLSVPRDLYGVPLPDGTRYEAKLNSLMSYADGSPERFADGAAVVKATIGRMLGHEIDYYAAIDLPGFARVVDAAGGVDVRVTREIADHSAGLYVQPGQHHFDGPTALLFVRSRMSFADSDFIRAERQQDLLLSLAAKLARPDAIASWPSVSAAVRTSVVTDVPIDELSRLAITLRAVQANAVERVVFQPPEFATAATGPNGAYILIPNLEAIRAVGERLLLP